MKHMFRCVNSFTKRTIYGAAFASPGSTRSVTDPAADKLLEKESIVPFPFRKEKHDTVCFWEKKVS